MKNLLIILISILVLSCEKHGTPSEYEVAYLDIGVAYGVAVDGNYAYVCNNKGVVIIDITNLEKPKRILTLPTDDAAFSLVIDDNTLYIGSSGSMNIEAYNIADPLSPIKLSSLAISGTVSGISKNGDKLYLATENGYFVIVDISDPENMAIVKSFRCSGQGNSILYNQGWIYYANSNVGLQLINIDNPLDPTIVKTISGTVGAWDISLQDTCLFLAKHMYGFSILSLSDKASPQHISRNDNGGEPYGIYTIDNLLYVADVQQGVEIWDISDLSTPVLIETIDEYVPHDLTARDDLVFLADQDRGFVILRY